MNRLEEELSKLKIELSRMKKDESRAVQIQTTYERKMELLDQPQFNDSILTSLYSKSFESNLNSSLMALSKRMDSYYTSIIEKMRKTTTRIYTNKLVFQRNLSKPIVEEFGDENITIETQIEHIESMVNTYVTKFRDEQVNIERQSGVDELTDACIRKIHQLEEMRFNAYISVNKYIDKLVTINNQLLHKSLEEFYSEFTKE